MTSGIGVSDGNHRRRAEAAGADRAQPACLDRSDRGRRRRRCRLERRQHRHRAAAVVGPDAAISRHGISAGPRLRVGRPRRRSRIGDRTCIAGQRVFVPGAKCFGEVRGLFGASASRLVVPAKRVVPIDRQPRRTRHPAGAGGDRLSRDRGARRRARRTASSVTACSAGCWRGSRSRFGNDAAGRVGEESGARRRRRSATACIDPEHDTAPRLPEHLRRQRRCRPARHR